MHRALTTFALGVALLPAAAAGAAGPPAASPPGLVLLTLDTTRADALGCDGDRDGETPFLDRLAARGTRYQRALAPSVLTLPAHATLLTGLYPPEHGVRDNGRHALPADLPTLATVLSERGWPTAAFVSSRVLDARFGLARGFATYDDGLVAERAGEHGYAERDAAATTRAALGWLRQAPPGPFFLWVHYYDPHAPYAAPHPWDRGSPAQRYAGEVTFMDREIGRLLAALPGGAERHLVVAVGDHGEALGSHGEATHGIFLYEPTVRVPLILAGPGVAKGEAVAAAVSTRGLAATVLRLLGVPAADSPLAARPSLADGGPLYSETFLTASAYGWAPLHSLTRPPWRYVRAPREELYHLPSDPGERRNLATERPEVAADLRRELAAVLDRPGRQAPAAPVDPEVAAQLRSLGYAAGGRGDLVGDGIDPKDGITMLAEAERAAALIESGRSREAAEVLAPLLRRNRRNPHLAVLLGRARMAAGDAAGAVDALRHAARLDPGEEQVHVLLGDALRRARRGAEAEAEYRLALGLDPRLAPGWLGLADLAAGSGPRRAILRQALAAGTRSAAVHLRLAELELTAGNLAVALEQATLATDLLPERAAAWLLRGRVELAGGQRRAAQESLERAARLAPGSVTADAARELAAQAGSDG